MEAPQAKESLYQYDEQFRDTIGTVDAKGNRIWLFPKKPGGNLHKWRAIVAAFLITLFFTGPFVKIGGRPLLLLNVFERKFIIFGQAFWPQDFVLLAILMILFFVFITMFTVVFGRIWCGWMCPQTLFLEMVFRKIEYWIEGDAPAQRRLKAAPFSFSKAGKKTLKHVTFILISVLISHTAMAYLIGIENVFDIVQHSPADNMAGFTGLVVFTGIFYSVFAKFREQACIAVCPYGRLQGVLLVKDSIVVAYDWMRGEPRTKLKKAVDSTVKTGDCIDCKLCVHVCPTGIDIRNGTQLECVNCTACIDACDEVMVKVNKPKGLIRYASYNSIQNGVSKLITPRVMGYSFVLLVLVGLFGFSLMTRTDVKTNVFKVPGTLYQKSEDGYITNLFNVEFVNKTFEDVPLELKVESPETASLVKADGSPVTAPAGGLLKTIYFIRIPADKIAEAKTVVYVGVYSQGKKMETLKIKFIGPVAAKKINP
jgi:cytochrome c oxidase accessory protein FixG